MSSIFEEFGVTSFVYDLPQVGFLSKLNSEYFLAVPATTTGSTVKKSIMCPHTNILLSKVVVLTMFEKILYGMNHL